MRPIKGKKRNDLLASKMVGHRVLIIDGHIGIGPSRELIRHENATIDIIESHQQAPDNRRLAEYTLVILDYQSFVSDDNKVFKRSQEVFEKQAMEALEAGTTLCFVHYNADVPRDLSYNAGTVDEASVAHFAQYQIGLKFLRLLGFRPYSIERLLTLGRVHRHEFQGFFQRWGASYVFFGKNNRYEKIEEPFLSLDDDSVIALAFAEQFLNGHILYLPFQRNHGNPTDIVDGVLALVDACLSYLTLKVASLPDWGNSPFLKEEGMLHAAIADLQALIGVERAKLTQFQEAKALLFQSQYVLERNVPVFISDQLGIPTHRIEKFREDFWLLDDESNRVVIGEVKSVEKGFKRSALYSLYNHREENKLDENFPALLVVNANRQAGSWKDKDRPIDEQDYQTAARERLLIVRVEDLVRLWDMRRQGLINSKEIFQLFLTERGWLEVTADLEIKVRC